MGWNFNARYKAEQRKGKSKEEEQVNKVEGQTEIERERNKEQK